MRPVYSRVVHARQAIADVIHAAWHAAERGPVPIADYAEQIETIISDAIEDEADPRCRRAFEDGVSEALIRNDNSN